MTSVTELLGRSRIRHHDRRAFRLISRAIEEAATLNPRAVDEVSAVQRATHS
jgi:hypothetical protein